MQDPEALWIRIATLAAQWGADQELEACVALVNDWAQRLGYPHYGAELRAARRPKPPTLKEQALAALEQVEADFNTGSFGDTIRRALEAFND
jgi:hypothetical protein